MDSPDVTIIKIQIGDETDIHSELLLRKVSASGKIPEHIDRVQVRGERIPIRDLLRSLRGSTGKAVLDIVRRAGSAEH